MLTVPNSNTGRSCWTQAVLQMVILLVPGAVIIVQLQVADPVPQYDVPIYDPVDQVQLHEVKINSGTTDASAMGIGGPSPA